MGFQAMYVFTSQKFFTISREMESDISIFLILPDIFYYNNRNQLRFNTEKSIILWHKLHKNKHPKNDKLDPEVK